jgi:hypothetical protein
MRRWYVVTPEYSYVVPVLDDGTGPLEYEADVIEIEAETKRDAISLGVKEMLRGWVGGCRYRWCLEQRMDDCSPYSGVKAYPCEQQEQGK